MTINLEDGREEIFQWDTGRTLVIEDPSIEQVHFSNSRFGTAIVVTVENSLATIPDELLQTPKQLHVWAFVGGGQCGYTKIERVFPVAPRNKPANYVYTPVKQDSLYALRKDLGNLDELETQSKESMVAAVNELRKEEDLLREMADGAVKTVNGAEPDEDGNVDITAGIQADWSQNDETAPDYINNRPGGYANVVASEPKQYTVVFEADDSGRENGIYDLYLENATFADVEIDGVKYENVPVLGDYYNKYVGDPELKMYPFVINYPVYVGAGVYAQYCYATEPGEKTVTITEKTGEIVKISENFLDLENVKESIAEAKTAAKTALPKSGGTMTGSLILHGDPVDEKEAATKQYVDTVKTVANNAQTVANNAQTAANNAQTAANNAQTAANNAQTAANNAGVNSHIVTDLTRSNITSGYFNVCAYADDLLVIGSFNDEGIYYSTDGKTWTKSNVTSGYFGNPVYSGGMWVISSSSNSYGGAAEGIYYSTDGKTWTESNVASGWFLAPAYADGLWVVSREYAGIY